jgi:hypothetical protein
MLGEHLVLLMRPKYFTQPLVLKQVQLFFIFQMERKASFHTRSKQQTVHSFVWAILIQACKNPGWQVAMAPDIFMIALKIASTLCDSFESFHIFMKP